MIIIKNVPELSSVDVMAAVDDMIPLDQIETGYGGIVVDERTALVFLQRYFAALEGTTASDPTTGEDPTEGTATKKRAARRKAGEGS